MLVIHIGTHKTGTSAVQAFFGSRADELDSRGVHYLRTGRAAGNAHHELPWGIRGLHDADLSAWDAVRAELKANDAATQVISSEAFWFTDPARVNAQLSGVENIRIVMYLRRQDKYLQSLYKQMVASGRRITFQQWRETFQFRGDYLSVVRRWADAFGKDALVIRPYERGGKTIDTVADFLGLLGFDAASEFQRTTPGRANPSPRRELMELIRAFNQLDVEVDREKFLSGVVTRNDAYIRSADLLTDENCATLVEEFADGNRTLAEEFYRDSEPLFPEMTRREPPVIWPPDSEEYFAMLVDMLDAVWKAARTGRADEGGRPTRQKTRKRGLRTSAGQPAAARTPLHMSLYVVFHDSVDLGMYEELEENEKSCLTLYGVNNRQATPLRTVYENELPAYNPSLQANKYNEASALYHVHVNDLADAPGYVGFFHYDMKFRHGAINEARSIIMRNPATNHIFATSLFTHRPFVGGQTSIVTDYPEHQLIGGLKRYNECFGTRFLPKILITTRMLMRNSFVISTQLFKKMMNWMQSYFIDDISACLHEPVDNDYFNPGHVIEALTGMFLALEVAQGAVYQRLHLHLEPGHHHGFPDAAMNGRRRLQHAGVAPRNVSRSTAGSDLPRDH